MAPLKALLSLYKLSKKSVITSMRSVTHRLDWDEIESDKVKQVKEYFEGIPVVIKDDLADEMLNGNDTDVVAIKDDLADGMLNGHDKDDDDTAANWKHVPITLQTLVDSGTKRIKTRRDTLNREIFWRDIKIIDYEHFDLHSLLKNCLLNFENLQHLQLNNLCTNEILEAIGKTCKKLLSFEFMESENTTDEGLHGIIPTDDDEVNEVCDNNRCEVKSHGCPILESLMIYTNVYEHVKYFITDNMKIKPLKFFKHMKSYDVRFVKFNLEMIAELTTKVEYLHLEAEDHKH